MTATRLGKYELRATLGRGAMGTVYDGWDPVIERRVAVKTVRLPDASDTAAMEDLARFKREAQAAGRLNHPNLVAVYDYGETSEVAYIVMEFVDGESLKALLDRQERFALPDILRLMEALLAGLRYSHERGVVHRDIKPSNLMVAPDGGLKIADFGIARIDSSSLTQAGTVMGTPAYMSPEQFMGQAVDFRTDLYSAGIVLYQLLTGERPFDGGMTTIMHKALNTEAPRPSEISVTAPAALDPVVARAMAKRPEQRFASAAAFAAALRDAALAPVAGPADSEATMVAAPRPRLPAPAEATATRLPITITAPTRPGRRAPLIAGGLLALVAASGIAWLATRPAGPPLPPAPPPVVAPPVVAPPAPAQPAPAAPQAPTAVTPPPVVTPPVVTPPVVTPPVVTPPAEPAPKPAALPPLLPPRPPPTKEATPQPASPPALADGARAALASALRLTQCGLVNARIDAGAVTLTGVAGPGQAEAVIGKTLQDAGAAAGPVWQVGSASRTFCGALDMLRPLSAVTDAGTPAFTLAMKDGIGVLHAGQEIAVALAMPDYPAYVYVDYLASDGSLDHFYPVSEGHATPPGPRAAGSTLLLGGVHPEPGFTRRTVAEPFGTDMIIAIASSEPLFKTIRPNDDNQKAYLRALQTAIDAARGRGARLAADALLLTTER